MNAEKTYIHIQDATKAKLAEDILLAEKAGLTTDALSPNDLISRAQAYPDRHILDIVYQDGLKAAMKTVIRYYAFPMVDFDQEYPMHYGFLSVFNFCGRWVASSPYDDTNLEEDDLYSCATRIRSSVNILLMPNLESFWSKDFLKKQDFLELLNNIRRSWNDSSFEFDPHISMTLLYILDFPAIKLADDPATRIRFAFWLKQLTACWPEVEWNWGDFDLPDEYSCGY